MKLNRNYITPFITLVFLVVGISGLLMFFHFLDGYTEVVHEILGLFFVVCAIFHIILNWKALKIHFKRKVFFPALFAALVISALLVLVEALYPPIDHVIINKIVKAPVKDAFAVLQVDSLTAARRLEAHGLSIAEAKTIEEIWLTNNADPKEILDIVLEL